MYNYKRILSFIIIGLIGVVIFSVIEGVYLDRLKQEFSFDIRKEGKIEAIVVEFIPWHGVTNVELSNGKKYWIDRSRNYNYDNIFIFDNINIGDSIIKNKDSDTLLIISSNGKFVFVVGEWINKPDE